MSLFCDSPPPDTFEISVFGSGIGESVVIHLTEDQWMVVDSFLTKKGKPAALAYLEGMNVSTDKIVRVVVSHWHDDHIKGISEVYEQAVNAKIVIPSVIGESELQMLIGSDDAKLKSASATEEMSRIFHLIHKRGVHRNRIADFDFASDNKPLYVRNENYSPKVWSLSPSSAAVFYALQKIRKYLPVEGAETPQRIPQDVENRSSVVLLLQVGSITALLGGDLETENDPNTGWQAIVQSQERPRAKAVFFKIPHHGSTTGYDPSVWQELLENRPWAALTPMRSSRLPSEEGVALIHRHTEKLWSTASISPPSKVKRHGVVEKQMKFCTRKRWVQEEEIGQVRFRVNLADSNLNPVVDCYPPVTSM